ncbi:cytochrome P450 [Apiospora hydei]|uniref:Cytochrome P450 n=1 Tax=Apiospora hydei TaxID=1337664 RepID=A0ABR1VJG2_9PEZI
MLLQIPTNFAQEIVRLSQQHGAIYSLRMVRQRYIVIADAGIAQQLLVTQAAKTSCREGSYIASKALWSGMGVITSSYGDLWRKHRQILEQGLRSQTAESAAEAMRQPLARLHARLAAHAWDEPELQAVFAEYTLEVFLSMLLGPHHDRIPRSLFNQAIDAMNEMLSYRRARRWRSNLEDLIGSILEYIEPEQGSTPVVPFGHLLLQMEEAGKINTFEKCTLSMVWLTAANASFPGFYASFMKAISSVPRVQQKVRQELDSGRDAHFLPPARGERLPYCRAVLLEAMRCNHATIDSPHVVTEEITLGQWTIPAGTALLLDTWTINHDETRFPRPLEFEVSEKPPSMYITL